MRNRSNWLAMAALCFACGESDGGSIYDNLPETVGDTQVSATVTKSGATLALETGARVSIPEGALREPVDIEVRETRVETLASPPDPSERLEKPVAMTPHGTEFERPVRVDLPLDNAADATDASKLRILRLDDEEDGTWERVPGDPRLEEDDKGKKVARFEIDRFSIYMVAVGEDTGGDAGSTTGAPMAGTGTDVGGEVVDGVTTTWDLRVIGVEDPCFHREFTGDPPASIDITVSGTRFTATGVAPWVQIDGDLSAQGQLSGTGVGTVAMMDGVTVSMDGSLQLAGGSFVGQVSWGNNAELSGGCPIVFMVSGTAR